MLQGPCLVKSRHLPTADPRRDAWAGSAGVNTLCEFFWLHTRRVCLNNTAEGFEPEVALALELQVHLWVRRREPGICRHWHREGEDAATMFEDQGERGVILQVSYVIHHYVDN